MCIYVCMYVCICVGMYKYVYVCIYLLWLLCISWYSNIVFDININDIICKHELPHVHKRCMHNIICNTYTLILLLVYVHYIKHVFYIT